jgi:integral membrane protein (TIGR00529 family)
LIPLIIKICSIIIALIIFIRLKLDLALSILLTTLLAILLFQINLETAFIASVNTLIEKRTCQLFVIMLMVLYMGAILKSKEMFQKLINSLNAFIKDRRIVAMVGPSILGFLPSPGGALLSAPLVEESTKKMKLKPEFNTFLNFWFRHFWEFVWPVYVGLLIFHTMSGIPMKKIILFQSPFTLLNIFSGLAVAFGYFKKHQVKRSMPQDKNNLIGVLKDFIEGIWPILLVIFLFFIISLPLYIALTLVSLILTLVKRLKIKEITTILFSRFILKTLLLIGSVMIFQKMITISEAFETLKGMDISMGTVVFFCFLISFSMGFLTGVNTAYIVIAYPILFPIIKDLPNFFYLSLYIYVIGFAGILYSPLHLCLVLTNEYFQSSLYKVYRYLTPPVLVMAIVSTGLVLIL